MDSVEIDTKGQDLVEVNHQDGEHEEKHEEEHEDKQEEEHGEEHEEEHGEEHEEDHDSESHDSDEAMAQPEMCIKHPLLNKWTLWFFKNDKARSWCENNRVVISFSTVEDFWALYNHIVRASRLQSGCDYSVFKEGIQPMWEDPENKKGGRWLISLNKNQRHNDLDSVWLEMLLCLIGEAFDEHGKEICGAVVNIRNKGDKLGVWTRDFSQQESILHIGKTLRTRLNMPSNSSMGYQAHLDTITKTGSMVKNRYQV